MSVASASTSGPGNSSKLETESQDHFEEINLRPSPTKNKYHQQPASSSSSKQLPITRNNFLQSRLKKSSSCNELVLQFEEHLRQQQGPFRPSAVGLMPRSSRPGEVSAASPIPSRRQQRPLLANHDLFEQQLNLEKTHNNSRPVQRIVSDLSGQNNSRSEKLDGTKNAKSNNQQNHKVVIYFGDSIGNRKVAGSVGDLMNASRSLEEVTSGGGASSSAAQIKKKSAPLSRLDNKNDMMKQLKSVLEEKKINTEKESKVILVNSENPPPPPPPIPKVQAKSKAELKSVVSTPPPMEKPPRKDKSTGNNLKNVKNMHKEVQKDHEFDFVESVTDGVINIKIDGSYSAARDLVNSVASAGVLKSTTIDGQVVDTCSSEPQSFDWSFVQEWRSRYGERRVEINYWQFHCLLVDHNRRSSLGGHGEWNILI